MPGSKSTVRLNLRITQTQYAILQNKKEARGYNTLSRYIKDILFERSLASEELILQIHAEVCKKKQDEEQENGRKKRRTKRKKKK